MILKMVLPIECKTYCGRHKKENNDKIIEMFFVNHKGTTFRSAILLTTPSSNLNILVSVSINVILRHRPISIYDSIDFTC